MKIIANNIGPGLIRYEDESFDEALKKIRRELKIYEQYIFGFVEKQE